MRLGSQRAGCFRMPNARLIESWAKQSNEMRRWGKAHLKKIMDEQVE